MDNMNIDNVNSETVSSVAANINAEIQNPETQSPESLVAQFSALVLSLQQELAELRAQQQVLVNTPRVPVTRASTTKKYVLLTDKLAVWGKVPQQQADIADILANTFEVGTPFTEDELIAALNREKDQYPALATSRQDMKYVFSYYRGLGNRDGKHAGYIARDFMRETV